MKELLYELFYNSMQEVSPFQVFTSIAISFIMAALLCFVYYLSFTGVTYNKLFNQSLMMLTMITTMVMNILGSSLALSLGMVGALSIVRFRTAIKDPRDTAYIFWCICIGLGCGSMNYLMVIFGSVTIAFICIVMSFFGKSDNNYLIIVRANQEAADRVRAQIFRNDKACNLRSETVLDSYVEMVYQIKLRKNSYILNYEEIKEIEGVQFVNVVARNGEVLG